MFLRHVSADVQGKKILYSVCLHGHKSGAPQTSGPDFNTQSREKETHFVGIGTYVRKLRTKRQHPHFPRDNCVHTLHSVHFIMWIKNNSKITKDPRTPPPQIQGRYKLCHAEPWHKITPESLFLHWAPKSGLTCTSILAIEEIESSCSHPFPHQLLFLRMFFMLSYEILPLTCICIRAFCFFTIW